MIIVSGSSRGLGAPMRFDTGAVAVDNRSSGGSASGGAPTPRYTCSLKTTPSRLAFRAPQTQMVCVSEDLPTLEMFKAVGRFLNVLFDKSGFLDGLTYAQIKKTVRDYGITWASEQGVIDLNTAKLYRAFVAAGVQVGQGIDTANDQKYIAANAPKIVEAISRKLSTIGINLPIPDYGQPLLLQVSTTATPPSDGGPTPGMGRCPSGGFMPIGTNCPNDPGFYIAADGTAQRRAVPGTPDGMPPDGGLPPDVVGPYIIPTARPAPLLTKRNVVIGLAALSVLSSVYYLVLRRR